MKPFYLVTFNAMIDGEEYGDTRIRTVNGIGNDVNDLVKQVSDSNPESSLTFMHNSNKEEFPETIGWFVDDDEFELIGDIEDDYIPKSGVMTTMAGFNEDIHL